MSTNAPNKTFISWIQHILTAQFSSTPPALQCVDLCQPTTGNATTVCVARNVPKFIAILYSPCTIHNESLTELLHRQHRSVSLNHNCTYLKSVINLNQSLYLVIIEAWSVDHHLSFVNRFLSSVIKLCEWEGYQCAAGQKRTHARIWKIHALKCALCLAHILLTKKIIWHFEIMSVYVFLLY